ncbi:MAG: OmpA family protein [Micropruina sp.]|uniref:OmpA family protein n=1 Tax=Micropruina sp. TaxID=2737536 RepID=UPI0039E4B224
MTRRRWTRARRLAIAAGAVWASVGLSSWCLSAVARADPTTPDDPSTVPGFPVLAFDGEARELTFPVATLDGSVTEDGRTITLRADVFFAYNKATLNTKAGAALARAAEKLTELGATKVRVDGHTDSKGSAAYNRGLSQRRAVAVRAALVASIPELAVTVKGYGEAKPVASNETGAGRALNRRVVITVLG